MKNYKHSKFCFYFLGAFLLVSYFEIASAKSASGVPTEASQAYLRALIYESKGNLGLALEEIEKAISFEPQSVYLNHNYAEYLFRLGRFKDAAEALQIALEGDPGNPRAFILAGHIQWALGQQTQAEDYFKKAVELAPEDIEPLVNLAVAVTQSDPQAAIKLYQDYLTRHPNEVDIHERLAQMYQSLGDFESAQSQWGRVLELNPSSLRAHLASAQIAELNFATNTAIVHYKAVLEQDPSNLPLLLRMGELQYRSDDLVNAQQSFELARTVAPESPSANFWLALIAENEGNWEEAIRLLKPIADASPEPGVMLRLSYYYSQANRRKDAISILKKLSEEDPENTDFLSYLALAYEQEGDYKKALDAMQKLIDIDINNPEHYFHIATLYDKLKKFPKTEEALQKALEIDPDYHMALNYLGYSYADRNENLARAEKLVNDAIALDPENGAYMDSMGWVYYRQEKYPKAIDFLKNATELTDDPLIWDHLGDAYFENGDWSDAYQSWAKAYDKGSKDKNIPKKISRLLKRMDPKVLGEVLIDYHQKKYQLLESVKGMAGLKVCEGRKCVTAVGELNWTTNKGLLIDVSSPLGAPFLQIEIPNEGAEKFGAFHPILELARPSLLKASRLLFLVYSDFLQEENKQQSIEIIKNSSRILIIRKGDYEFSFSKKTGNPLVVGHIVGSQTDTLEFKSIKKINGNSYPTHVLWTTTETDFTVEFDIKKPLMKINLPADQE